MASLRSECTVLEQRFVDYYMVRPEATWALKKAGSKNKYPAHAANEMLHRPRVQKYLESRLRKLDNKLIMDANEAMELLTRIARGEEQETIVIGTGDGVYRDKKEADNKTRIVAAKEILKRYPKANPMYEAQVRRARAEAKKAERDAAADSNDKQVVVNVKLPDDN